MNSILDEFKNKNLEIEYKKKRYEALIYLKALYD